MTGPNEGELACQVETMFWLDVKALAAKGLDVVVFGIKEAKNGFGRPTIVSYIGSGNDREAACADALEVMRRKR